MSKLTAALLVATLFLAPVLAAAQISRGAESRTPGGSPSDRTSPTDRPTGSPGIGPPPPSGSDTSDAPAASPPRAYDLYWLNTKADCEKAGGRWGPVSQSCTQK